MRILRLAVLGSLGLSALLSLYSAARTQEQPVDGGGNGAAQEGVAVMARGPVHEAFAEVSIRSPRPSPRLGCPRAERSARRGGLAAHSLH